MSLTCILHEISFLENESPMHPIPELFSHTECGHCGQPATFLTASSVWQNLHAVTAPPFPRHAGVNDGFVKQILSGYW